MKYVVARIDEGKNASEIIKDVSICTSNSLVTSSLERYI